MKTEQKIVIRADEVAGLATCDTDCFIRLTCGSTISIDTKVIRGLVDILGLKGSVLGKERWR